MKLHVLNLGKIVMVGSNPVMSSDEPLTLETAPAIPIHAFLIDSPIGYIVFDAGCDPEGMTGAWPVEMTTNPFIFTPEQTMPAQLAKAGIKPEDVSYLILSHLHLDHAGTVHMFPNAKVYVQKQELDRTMSDYKNGTLDIFHVKSDVENWIRANTQWIPVCEDLGKLMPVCEGLSIMDLKAGHSFGMLAAVVELKCGTYMLVADAAYSAFHYGPPARPSGAIEDEKGYYAALETIRAYADAHNATVLFGHDIEQFKTLKKAGEGYYE